MRYSAEMQTMQQKLSQKLGEKVQVTDQELQDTYEKQKFQFVQPAELYCEYLEEGVFAGQARSAAMKKRPSIGFIHG